MQSLSLGCLKSFLKGKLVKNSLSIEKCMCKGPKDRKREREMKVYYDQSLEFKRQRQKKRREARNARITWIL